MSEEIKRGCLSYYLVQIEEKIEGLIKRHEQYSESDYLLGFRGERRDYGSTSLMPSLFRNKDYVSKEKYLFELLGDYGFLDNGTTRNIDRAIEAQHYIAISRMLDISFSILPALYFACGSGDASSDGYLFIFCFPEHYSPHSQYIEQFYTEILDDNETSTAYSSNFKVISHSYSNDRIKAQVGGFIFFPGNEYKPIQSIYYEKINIKAEDKKMLLKELDMFFHINEASLFPEKEKLVPIIETKFREGSYSDRRITVEGEVSSYFQRIEYEIEMLIHKKEVSDKIELLRRLRKEESDLLYFIEHSTEDEKNKTMLAKHTIDNFRFLKIKYGGRK